MHTSFYRVNYTFCLKMKAMVHLTLLSLLLASVAAHGRGSNPNYHYDSIITCSSRDAIRLYQSDFENGTVVIEQPGYYCLGEDVAFDPNSADTLRKYGQDPSSENIGRVLNAQFTGEYGNQVYTHDAYGVGFFAAIAVTADSVTIDLNGCTLESSREFALLQRFYSNIEVGG